MYVKDNAMDISLVITIITSLITGGSLIKLLEIMSRRGVVRAEEKQLVINIQGDLLTQLKDSLLVAKQEREDTRSCKDQYDRLEANYNSLEHDYKTLQIRYDNLLIEVAELKLRLDKYGA